MTQHDQFMQANGERWRSWLPWTIGLIGLLLSTVVYFSLQRVAIQQNFQEFEREVKARTESLNRSVRGQLQVIDLIPDLHHNSTPVDDKTFGYFAQSLMDRYASIEACYWAPAVRAAASDDWLFPIAYSNERTPVPFPIGHDLASDSRLSDAILAIRQGRTAIAHPPADDENSRRLFVITPYFASSDGQTATDDTAQFSTVKGVLMVVIDAVKVVRTTFHDWQEPGFRIAIESGTDDQLISVFAPASDTLLAGTQSRQSLDFSDVHIVLIVQPTKRYVSRQRNNRVPYLSFALGLLLSCLSTSILRGLVGRTLRIEDSIQQRSLELSESNKQLEHQINERKEAEGALSESLAAYQSLIESLPLNVFRKDLSGTIVDANQRFCDTIGHTMEETIGKSDFALFPVAQAQKYRDDDDRVTQSGEVLEDIEEHVKNDGDRLCVQVLKAPARDAKGEIVGVQGMFWDVTARVLAEEARHLSDAKFRRLVESDIIGVMIASLDGRILDANDEFLRIIAYSRGELDSGLLRWDTQTPEEYRHLDDLAVQQLEETGACRPWEKEYVRKDGSRIAVLIGIAAIDHTSDECICWVLDITDRKRMEDELKRAKEAADSASNAKSQFLANMSHEIRTPMNAVIGMTELVLQSPLTLEQKDYLKMVLHSGESLLAVINDILDFSKVEAGKLEIDAQPFDFFDTVGDTMKSLALRAHAKQLEIACDIASDVPTMLIGDGGRIRQVVLNLVGNAIKFTQQGEVVLTVRVEEEDQQALVLHFDIRDTGDGIPLAKQEQIFAAFEQADATTTREHGGTGLGLPIARRLVELMGGHLWVESTAGEGSTFHFTVLLNRCSGAFDTRPQPQGFDVSQATVLIVDDSCTTRQIMSRMLSQWKIENVIADGVASAVDLLGSHEPPFDVIIADANMPSENGLSLLHQMRALAAYEATPVVTLTTGELPHDRQQSEQVGVCAHLLKPVKQSELHDALVAAWASRGTTPMVPPANTSPAKLRSLKVLLAEDSAVNQMLAKSLLEEHHHTVTVAHNGHEAVQLVASMDFDLILMDVQMPVQDGLDATAEIRRREQAENNRRIPIVAVTAHAMKGDREKCLKAGMDEYLSKPIRAAELYATIERVIQRFDSRDVASANLSAVDRPYNGPQEPINVNQTTAVNSASSDGDVEIDWNDALAAVNGNEALLRELTGLFKDEGPRLLQEVVLAVQSADCAGVKLAAHTLKGSARYFGRNPVCELAAQIEKFASDDQLDATAQPLAELQARLPQLLLALDARYSGEDA